MSKQYPEAAMTSDLEIIRVAASLIREHGDQAAQSDWARAIEAVEGIQSQIRLKDLGVPGALRPFATMHPTAPR